MSDAFFFTVMGILAAGMIALALVWPQGLGERSPAPFGHRTAAEMRADQQRQIDPNGAL